MNVFAKFDEIPSMILQDIKETKCYGHKNVSDTQSDNVKTVYPPTNTVCGGIRGIIKPFAVLFQPLKESLFKLQIKNIDQYLLG